MNTHYDGMPLEILPNHCLHCAEGPPVMWILYETSSHRKLSSLLALCEGNPPVTGGFPSQRASNMNIWSQPEQAVEQTVELLVISDIIIPMWHHCNAIYITSDGELFSGPKLRCTKSFATKMLEKKIDTTIFIILCSFIFTMYELVILMLIYHIFRIKVSKIVSYGAEKMSNLKYMKSYMNQVALV